MSVSYDEIAGAVARGWCSPENEAKEMDADLAQAISEEVFKYVQPKLRWWNGKWGRLSAHIWGLSIRWFCVCPWNGESFWTQLPFLYFEAGKQHVEMRVGGYTYGVTFDIRWRWD